jgi:hypothetical protein
LIKIALKTFNLDKEVYGEFSKHCKKHGISMSKKVEKFIKKELENIKAKKSDVGDLGLDIEKDVKPRPPSDPSQGSDRDKEHGMGKYC